LDSSSPLLRLVLVATIGVLMGLNAIDVFGFVRCMLVGRSFFTEGQVNVRNFKQVILPDPDSSSLEVYANCVGDKSLPTKIRTTTEDLLEKQIDVRWYPHTIGHAIIIADPLRSAGWIQIESVLPHVSLPQRTSLVVRKQKFEQLVASIAGSFDKMFNASVRLRLI
jgi:hypothetical protein